MATITSLFLRRNVPIQTRILFKNFVKALEVCAEKKNIYIRIVSKPGTGRRIELFKDTKGESPFDMFVVHEARFLYSGDFKKACTVFGFTKQEFLKILDSVT